MKRIEKYTLKELYNKYLKDDLRQRYDNAMEHGGLLTDFVNYCYEEIKTTPRIALINTEEELKQAWCEYIDSCVDLNKEGSVFDFYMFLKEKIGVE